MTVPLVDSIDLQMPCIFTFQGWWSDDCAPGGLHWSTNALCLYCSGMVKWWPCPWWTPLTPSRSSTLPSTTWAQGPSAPGSGAFSIRYLEWAFSTGPEFKHKTVFTNVGGSGDGIIQGLGIREEEFFYLLLDSVGGPFFTNGLFWSWTVFGTFESRHW